jgi:hypothetical protein
MSSERGSCTVTKDAIKFWSLFILGMLLLMSAISGIVAIARYQDLKQADKSCVLQGGHAKRIGSHYFLCLDDNQRVVGRP